MGRTVAELEAGLSASEWLDWQRFFAVEPFGTPLLDVIQAQTRAACERIAESLEACGARFDQVVKVTVWLSSMDHFAGFNEVYKAFFGAALPVRSTVASALALGVDVEIEVQAFVGEG